MKPTRFINTHSLDNLVDISFVEKSVVLDMDAYKDWINKLCDEWKIPDQVLSSGRIKKKNAGEVSITIFAELAFWYYPETVVLTIYFKDAGTGFV